LLAYTYSTGSHSVVNRANGLRYSSDISALPAGCWLVTAKLPSRYSETARIYYSVGAAQFIAEAVLLRLDLREGNIAGHGAAARVVFIVMRGVPVWRRTSFLRARPRKM
jgi:hypothetical protein